MSFILVGLAWPVVARDLPIYASFGGVYSDTDTTASTDTQGFTTFPPPEIPLDGLPFDDDDLGWSAALGYQFRDFFAVELGYMDLGTVESDAFTFTVPGPTPVPRPAPAIESTAWFLSAQFQYPLRIG